VQPIDTALAPGDLHVRALRDLPAPSIITDAQHRIVFANQAFEAISGYSVGELLGVSCLILQGRDTDVATAAALRAALHDGRHFRGQILNYRKDGTPFWNLLTVTPLRNAENAVTHFVSVQLDVTERVDHAGTTATLIDLASRLTAGSDRTDIASRAAEATCELGAERSVVAVLDQETATLRIAGLSGWGPRTAEVQGFESVDHRWRSRVQLLRDRGPRLITPATAPAWGRDLLVRYGCTALVAVPLTVGDTARGFVLAAWSDETPPAALPRVLADRLAGVAGLTAAALVNLDLIERIRRAAQVDHLTALATRAALQQHLTEALAPSDGGFVGVLCCDVDRFDWINDALGHDGGDEALRRVADVLRAACPAPAMVSRPGGNGFMIVLPEVGDPEEVTAFVRDLDERFRTALTVHGREIYVTLSIGSAVAPRGGPTTPNEAVAERIIRDADAAMYRVKEARHGQGIAGTGSELLQLDADLHHAMDRGEIVAYFQPQYDSRAGHLTGYEALARWHHPEHGSLPPDRFIPLAEADGLIDRLGDEILEQACRFADLVAADRPLQMEVNVSARQLSTAGLADRIGRVLAGYPDRAWTLSVEITESALILDQDLVRTELAAIRGLGVGVSIDDFGSGYSSLSQLRDLPATELKIDQSFVHREDAVGTSLLTAIIALAHSLDLTVVAEGIETESQLGTLRTLGCERLQGMYLCPPLVAEEARAARADITALLPPSR
jgi:diguanylate cyclase (GGDEF)-like protein/PAS domain S-box-containing protein